MWHLRTGLSAGRGAAGLMLALGDLKGLFQPKQFHDSLTAPNRTHGWGDAASPGALLGRAGAAQAVPEQSWERWGGLTS